MRILFIADIIGKPGRRAVRLLLPGLRERYAPDVVIANGENLAGGAGVTAETSREMFRLGIAALTTGNHVFDRRESPALLTEESRVLRPLNYPPGTPGCGWIELAVNDERLVVVSLQGRVFMRTLDDPFRAIDALLAKLDGPRHILVDVHAEATAEKQALGYHLDGRVSAVIGTHTHVPTADAHLLPRGTGYITDAGMVGPRESVIGMEVAPVIQRHLTQMFHRYEVAKGPVVLNAILLELDHPPGARSIELIQEVTP